MSVDFGDYRKHYIQQYDADDFEVVLVAARRKQVMNSLKRYPHKRILEVGCGLEPLFPLVDNFSSYTVVDPVESFIENARKVASGDKRMQFHVGCLEDVSCELFGDLDFIVVSSLLHEVEDPIALLRSISNCCTKNTTIHFNVPNMFSFHRLLAVEMGLQETTFEQSELERKFQRTSQFDKQSFLRILRDNGFNPLNFGTYFIKPFSNSQMSKLIRSKILPPELVLGLSKLTQYLPEMGVEMFADAISVE
jgi:SAM-dependent methyltransferase